MPKRKERPGTPGSEDDGQPLLPIGERSTRALDAATALERSAKRGGLPAEQRKEAVDHLDRLRLEHALYRWTALRGTVPSVPEWDAEAARTAGWPTPEEIGEAFADFDALIEEAGLHEEALARQEAKAALSRREAQLEEELERARKAQTEAKRVQSKHRELERQHDKAKQKAEEAREAARCAAEQQERLEQELTALKDEADALRTQAGRGLPTRLPAPGLDAEGRPVYALWLGFHGDATFERAVAIAAGWVERGAHAESLLRLDAGRLTVAAEQPGASIEVHSYAEDERRLWQLVWRQPFRRSLYLQAEVTVASAGDQVLGGLTLRILRPSARLDRVSFAIDPPNLPALWLRELAAHDGGVRLGADAVTLDEDELEGLLGLLDSGERRRPVVVAMDAGDVLATACAGLAHVVVCPPELLGDLRDLAGVEPRVDQAVVVWPGAQLPVHPESLTLIEGGGRLAERVARQLQAAAVVGLPAPTVVGELRRAAARARLGEPDPGGADTAELEALFNEAAEENQELRARAEGLQAHTEQLERRIGELERTARRDGLTEPPAPEPELLEDEPGDIGPGSHAQAVHHVLAYARKQRLESVRAAVDKASSGLCRHLTFSESACSTADASPYRSPENVLADLIKLNRVAEMYLRGAVGQSLHSIAQELGLDWVEDCNAADHGATARHYRFRHHGREWTLRQHVRVGGRASGDGNIARIYLALHPGDDEVPRAVIVGHVGRHLPDTTT